MARPVRAIPPTAVLYAVINDRLGCVCGLAIASKTVIAAAPRIGWCEGKPEAWAVRRLCAEGWRFHRV
jgi:hypothetical protein